MPAAVEVKESFSVQSPAISGTAVFAEQVKTLVSLGKSTPHDLPAIWDELAALYQRVPPVDDQSGGLSGDLHPY